MKVVIQRVTSASVTVNEEVIGKVGEGLALLVGYGKDSSKEDNVSFAKKIVNMRIFSDDSGRFQYSALDVKGEILAVPQFTLYADTNKGRRPDFNSAKEPTEAKELFLDFVKELNKTGLKIETGEFGADMEVKLVNSGPVTILL